MLRDRCAATCHKCGAVISAATLTTRLGLSVSATASQARDEADGMVRCEPPSKATECAIFPRWGKMLGFNESSVWNNLLVSLMSVVQPLTLIETMVHEVPRGRWKKSSTESVVLSDDPTPLNPQTDRFIREGMLQPALADSRQIIETGDGDLVPALVREALLDNARLPDVSRQIAQHLHESQTSGASAGVFMASLVEEDGLPRFAILKAEHQEGVRLRQTGAGTHVAFEVEHISELIVGQNSRVYKIALLWLDPHSDVLRGLMVDKQNGVAYADYFLSEFLGMQLLHDAEVLTRDFLNAATGWLSQASMDPAKRTRYSTALVALMESPDAKINPPQFLKSYIDPEDRDSFAAALPAHAHSSFRKDVTLVKGQIGGLRFNMANGVSISATAQALEDGTVEVQPDGPSGPQVVVKGAPETIALAKPPKRT